jgi:hypothetical protein
MFMSDHVKIGYDYSIKTGNKTILPDSNFWKFHAEVKNINYCEHSHKIHNFPLSNSKPKVPLTSQLYFCFFQGCLNALNKDRSHLTSGLCS